MNAKMFSVVTWNVAGAKFLEFPENIPKNPLKTYPMTRGQFQESLHAALKRLTQEFNPDVIMLQEIVRYGRPNNPNDLIQVAEIPGYYYDASIAISTTDQSHPQKWDKYFGYIDQGKTKRNWEPGTYLSQGYGILWREGLRHASIWDFKGDSGSRISKEIVRLETGLFTGSRDTEPRLAVVTHFIIDFHDKELDIFVVNLHLTTLKGEREGSPDKDVTASRVRLQQLNTVVNGIVSRYNEWVPGKIKEAKKNDPNFTRVPAVWVLGGDFNCMPQSSEIAAMEQMNFIDLNPHKGSGTKGSTVPIETATIALDFLFAGPAYYSLDPYLAKIATENNPLPLKQYRVSDHFPVLADVPIVAT